MVFNEKFHSIDHSREARFLNYKSNLFLHVPGKNEFYANPILSTRQLNIRLRKAEREAKNLVRAQTFKWFIRRLWTQCALSYSISVVQSVFYNLWSSPYFILRTSPWSGPVRKLYIAYVQDNPLDTRARYARKQP